MNSATLRILLFSILISFLQNFSYGSGDQIQSRRTVKIFSLPWIKKGNLMSASTQYFSVKSLNDSTLQTARSLFYIETDPSALFFNGAAQEKYTIQK